jgi:hypothetical protein
VASAAGVVLVLAYRAEPVLRACIVEELTERFHARVELDSFHLSLVGGLWVEGKGLRIWPPAQVEGITVPGAGKPLIRLAEFRFRAPLHYKPGQAIRISVVELKGLDVDLPPRSHFGHGSEQVPGHAKAGAGLLRLQLDSMECAGAHLRLETSKPGKLPLEFAIARLNLTRIGEGGAMGFAAELTNPRPAGTIHTTGRLGPWPAENTSESSQGRAPAFGDLGESPIAGDYRFDHADLSGFKGIAGILSSTGHYQGTLRDLVVDGKTDTPDFRLKPFDKPLPLHTEFHARVDGTNGDTWLEPVEATLGHSHFTAQGQIVRVAVAGDGKNGMRAGGHDIALAINVDRGRMEDFLSLASHSETPLLTGTVTMKATLHIPPGTPPVHERMRLAGSFAVQEARFTSAKIQNRIEELSLRGQGRPNDVKSAAAADIRSTMQGNFEMADAVIRLPALAYTVPGAQIQLTGTYGVENGALDFAGSAKMQATVSEMVGGWKGLLLKPADRFFKKDGAGTEVPIHIGGTRADPQFGIDFGRMKRSKAGRQDEPQ